MDSFYSLLSLVPSSGQGHNGVKTDIKSHSNCFLKFHEYVLPILLYTIATRLGFSNAVVHLNSKPVHY